MPLSVQFFCALLVLLVASRVLGEIAVRLGQPQLVGELVAGVGIGVAISAAPNLLPHLVQVSDSEVFEFIVELGAFFLMLLAGLELQPGEIAKSSARSAFVALGGVVLPLLAGVLLGWWFLPPSEARMGQILLLGVVLAITDVPTALWVLRDLKRLHTPPGRMIVSAAIFDDVLGLLLLAFLTAVLTTGAMLGWLDTVYIVARIAAFFVFSILIGVYVFPRLRKLLSKLHETEHEFSELIVAALTYGLIAEWLGLHLILGAFIAGLFFLGKSERTEMCEAVKCKMSGITSGFLAPILFASVGLNVDLEVIWTAPLFLFLLLVLAVLSKIVGCGVTARLGGLNARDALNVGVAMSARGAVALVVARIGLEMGVLPDGGTETAADQLYSALVMVAIVTAIFMPVVLRVAMLRRDNLQTTEVAA